MPDPLPPPAAPPTAPPTAPRNASPALVILVMGVSGSGKSTVARGIAEALGCAFQEGDDLHPAANVAKMRAGVPLDDEDRWPWLRRIAEVIDQWRAQGQRGVLTCSALKRAYRDVLIGDRRDVALVYLQGSREVLARHMQARTGHFMPVALLDSQLATLEPPGADENPLIVSVEAPPAQTIAAVLSGLRLRGVT